MNTPTGKLLAIQVRPSEGASVNTPRTVQVLDTIGLEGDYQAKLPDAAKRNRAARAVTLIESEAVAAANDEHGVSLTPQESCRNLVTQGVDLNALVDRELVIGDPLAPDHVVLKGTGLCHPCSSLEKRTRPRVKAALKGRGGLCAEIIKPGTIRAGDAIQPR